MFLSYFVWELCEGEMEGTLTGICTTRVSFGPLITFLHYLFQYSKVFSQISFLLDPQNLYFNLILGNLYRENSNPAHYLVRVMLYLNSIRLVIAFSWCIEFRFRLRGISKQDFLTVSVLQKFHQNF